MKLPPRFVLPPLDKGARLPLLLAASLCAALIFQLSINDAGELPPADPVGGGGVQAGMGEDVAPTGGAAVLVASAPFTVRTMSAPGTGAPVDPLGGVTVAGSIRVGRAVFAIVQGPGSRIVRLRPGARIGDWRLHAIRDHDVLFVRGDEQLAVPFGAKGSPPATAAVARNQ
ncbi:MAG TPA: hypothetical protein VF503_05995 [Sphingobium sp.]|uniref:hypothetical protein n=1 Tax=Sphingobium sp. TaxID=1912891 RepID=UPI002ED19E0A